MAKRYFIYLLYIISIVTTSCNSTRLNKAKPEPKIIPRSEWNAAEPVPFRQHVPVRITVHHEGTRLEPTDDAAKKIKNIQTWGMGKDRNWTDVPYHFLISPNGKIYEGRNPFTVGETATEYDPSGHLLITCLGNMNEQEVSPEQLESLLQMIVYACKTFKIDPSTIATHRDYSSQTTCPGKNLYAYFQNGYILKEVKKRLN